MKQLNGTYTVHTLFQHIRWKHTNSAKPKNHTRTHRSLIRSRLATSYLWILFINISCFLKITVDRSEKSTSYVITHSCITDTRQIFTHTDPTNTIICVYKQSNIYMESIYLSIYPSVSDFLHQLSIRLSIPTPSLSFAPSACQIRPSICLVHSAFLISGWFIVWLTQSDSLTLLPNCLSVCL